MKKVLMAAVFAVMAGGVCAADFADLQTFKAADVKTAVVPETAEPVPAGPQLQNTVKQFYQGLSYSTEAEAAAALKKATDVLSAQNILVLEGKVTGAYSFRIYYVIRG